MRGDEPARRLGIFMLAPALGEHRFLPRLQHREMPDLIEITSKPAFARDHRQRSSHSTFSLRPLWSASLDWVRQAAALGFDSMELLGFPSAYQPDLHSKAADSWSVEIQIWA